ncbi:conserved hypothetical protein [Flavobacterium sp. 9R]|uniref:META domain-containing protein n=1 Tax=Flavobacterium sp. 9R TaxID=2653143 RepID=UPI0012F20293|nr:META domain-containing protein [Flavobacterium sp. 9R]VXB16420.1 conserved hypothetical protein [Flavobacterium sp. 9R]
MKKSIATIILSSILITSCYTSKTTTMDITDKKKANTLKGNLIDGTWEANYIMNTPKAFGELYLRVKPSITINSYENRIGGVTGCNNFTGKCTIDGNKIMIADALAATRKMCPDMAGEQLFLETLKKVNAYSVTNQGKTLNLIMGDIAVMRLERK